MSLSYKVHPWAFGTGAAAHRGLRARGRPPEELSGSRPDPQGWQESPQVTRSRGLRHRLLRGPHGGRAAARNPRGARV